MEKQKYKAVRVPFSSEEKKQLKKFSEKVHLDKDSVVIKKIIQESRDIFHENNKFGIYVEFAKPVKRECLVTVYFEPELYNWLKEITLKLDHVTMPWFIRYLVCPKIKE